MIAARVASRDPTVAFIVLWGERLGRTRRLDRASPRRGAVFRSERQGGWARCRQSGRDARCCNRLTRCGKSPQDPERSVATPKAIDRRPVPPDDSFSFAPGAYYLLLHGWGVDPSKPQTGFLKVVIVRQDQRAVGQVPCPRTHVQCGSYRAMPPKSRFSATVPAIRSTASNQAAWINVDRSPRAVATASA